MKSRYMISCAIAAVLSGVAQSAMADQPGSTIEEIVVSAERRDESVSKVPATIQAFSGDQLADLNISDFQDLLKLLPNVSYGNNGPGQGEIFIRGLSNGFRGNQSSATVGNFPNTAIYLDDQSFQFPARNVDIYLVDMQRVEVLEGPQGTLFGGGAEAGAVRYITNKPNLDTFQGKFEGTAGVTEGGDYNSSFNAMLNVPIIDGKFAVRAVLYNDHQGGYIDNVPSTFTRSNQDLGNYYWGITPVAGKCPNGLPAGAAGLCSPPNSGQVNNLAIASKNQNPVTHQGARLEAAYKVNGDWDILITESLMNLDADGLSVEYPTGSDFQTLQPLQVTAFTPSYDHDHTESTSWTVNGKVGPIKLVYTGGWTVRNVKQQMEYTNYSRTGGGMYYQCTGGTTGWGGVPYCYSPVGYWDDTFRNTHLSNEFRASTPDDWRFRAIIGAYQEQFHVYDNMNFKYKTLPSCNAYNLANLASLPGGPVCASDVTTAPGSTANQPGVRDDSTAFGEDTQRGYNQYAVFANFDYDVIPDTLTVSAGTRWYQYNEFEVGSQYATTPACENTPNGTCTTHGLVNIDNANDHSVYVGFRSKANITYHLDENTLVYYLWSQGFRPGGFNRSSSNVAPGIGGPQYRKPNSYAPDSLTNNEIGLKTSLFDHTLQLSLSAYYMRWHNVQFLFFNPPVLGNTTFGVNGPTYDEKGVELQAAWRAAPGLTFQGSGAYNDNTQANSPCLVDNIPASPGYGKCITQAYPKGSAVLQPFTNPFGSIGSVAAFSPKFTGSLRGRYDFEFQGFTSFGQLGVNYTGGMWNQPATYSSGVGVLIPNTTYLRYYMPAYTTLDGSIGAGKGNWFATLYATNLTNNHASTFTSSAQFIQSEVPLRPRVIGVKLDYSFQ